MGHAVQLSAYRTIDKLLELIDEPAQTACKQILSDNRSVFQSARASTHTHQTWVGGYIDRVTDGMNYACDLFALESARGRPIPFSLSDVLFIFFLHDLRTPWGALVEASRFSPRRSGLEPESAFNMFRDDRLREYGILLAPAQLNALKYIKGENEYLLPNERAMGELAGFCHMIDTWCSYVRHDYPKECDEWSGAGRFRITPEA